MNNLNRKKLVIIAGLALVLLSMVFIPRLMSISPYPASDLECDSLSRCKTSTSCGGPGSVTGCTINCESGAVIFCPSKN